MNNRLSNPVIKQAKRVTWTNRSSREALRERVLPIFQPAVVKNSYVSGPREGARLQARKVSLSRIAPVTRLRIRIAGIIRLGNAGSGAGSGPRQRRRA